MRPFSSVSWTRPGGARRRNSSASSPSCTSVGGVGPGRHVGALMASIDLEPPALMLRLAARR